MQIDVRFNRRLVETLSYLATEYFGKVRDLHVDQKYLSGDRRQHEHTLSRRERMVCLIDMLTVYNFSPLRRIRYVARMCVM